MNTPDLSEEHAALRAALQRAAARVPEPAFDSALHDSTMRRLEALARTHPSRASSRWPLLAATVAGLLVLGPVGLAWLGRRPAPPRGALVKSAPASAGAAVIGLPPLTLAYERAAAQGDEQFFAMLDHAASQPSLLSPPVSSRSFLFQR